MKKIALGTFLIFSWWTGIDVRAGGISVDAGLTPPQDRYILRTQYRYMSMTGSTMRMATHMVPLVVAYGVTPGFSVMARGMYVVQSSGDQAGSRAGFNDLYLLTKYRLYRKNTANYVFGVAPYLASNVPIGNTDISMRTWNPEVGLNITFRPRFLSFDLSAAYTFLDVLKKSTVEQGDQISLNTAFSALIPFGSESESAISPVVELSYLREFNTRQMEDAGNGLLFLSPGISYIWSSLSIEGLIQFPLLNNSTGSGMMVQGNRLIVGVKYMF